jgi:RNA polymerase sigma factor (sigma-70 family)
MLELPGQKLIKTVKEYGNRLFRFVRGRVKTNEDAEDILQDIWYQLSNVVNIDEIEQMSGWLFQVARNKITDKYRKKTTQSLEELTYQDEDGELNFLELFLENNFNPETEFLRDIFWEELMLALEELPENQKTVFVLNELEDITLQQIADQTGENLKTIISRKAYATKFLRKRLENLYNEIIKN